ncbi:PAH and Sin3 corepress domain containing protein [Trichuris trichiura]|uniref:PAH and Sin3 corepress domain containing protein n=1 Tax=Trichuris trichiura TaxID=36087 RepID=A0A077Z7Z9_TRITR|nr:PAH and Sin3 corepress domain containing protein [Trichuris trichiura]
MDILQAYQKEQLEKPTNSSGRSSEADAQVFSQVAQLFANDKDLLEEFSQFLPDAPLMQLEKPSPSVVAATSTTTTTTTTTTTSSSSSSKETAKSVDATVTDNGEKVVPLSSESTPATGEGDGDLKEQPLRSARRKRKCPAAAPPVPYSETIMTRKRTRSAAAQLARQNAALVKKSNEDRRDEKKPKRDVTFDQYMFLEKLRYTVSNDDMYKGLLRVLKLFSQSYLTVTDVQDLFRSYVPDETELLDWFSKPALPSSESSPVNAGEGTVNQRRTISDGCPDVDFSRCKQLGVSYRLIPAKYQYPKCTGRTPLGKEVLNFKYLSFPVFQSEENPKTTSKRSPFQETLYTTEDEHFETDIVIAVNRCLTEGLLSAEAMVRRLKQKYSLDIALNTRSVTIAQRALRMLMQKNDDWHKNLRRMKPMWQEMNINCYWKALDYHDITFKSDDQKDKRTRSLLAAVEALFDQRRAKAEKENREIQSGPHVIVQFPSCTQAFHDTGELVVHYMKRQTNVGLLYKRQMAIIVKVMLPPLFNLKPASLSDVEQELPAVENRDKNSSTANGSNSRNASNKGGRCRGGYRRRAGAKGRGNAKVATTPSSSTESTAVDKNEKSESLQDFPILEDLTLLGPMPRYSILFGPSPWYVFLRLYCILSERLSGFYDASRDLASKFGQEEFSYLYETTVLRNRFTSNSKVQPDDLYNQFLNLTKHWLDGGIESTTYEDAVRDVFTLRAYKAFTIDQIVHTMYRQLYVIVSELTPVKAFKLHETWAPRIRCAPNNVERQLLEKSYQAEAIALTEGQKCFKIQFLPLENRKVTFELLDKASPNEAPRKCQESNAIVPVKAGDDINQAMLQRNVNRAMDYFAKQLLKVQEETGTKCGRLNGASRTGPQMARTVSQLFYWQRSTRVYLPLTSVQARNRHNFKLHMLRKFWKKDQTSKTDDDLEPETHGEIFCRFHEKWTAENVTKEQNSFVNELLSGTPGKKNMSAAWMSRCEEPCSRRPPYFVVNRYFKWKEK